MLTLGLWGLPGGAEWIVILIIGLLLFGRRLPEVGRSLGQGLVEFKRGLKGVGDELEDASDRPVSRPATPALSADRAGGAAHIQAPASPEGQDLRVSRAEKVE